jgi:hypothetical protein
MHGVTEIMAGLLRRVHTGQVRSLMTLSAFATRANCLIRQEHRKRFWLTTPIFLGGVIVYAVGRFAIRANDTASILLILAGFLLVSGVALYWWYSRIRSHLQEYKRTALWISWWTAIFGGAVVAVGILVGVGRPASGAALSGLGFTILLLVAPSAYFVLSSVRALRVQSVTKVVAIATLLGFFVLCLPAAVILLITDEHPNYWLGPQTNSPIEGFLLFSIPFLLVLIPVEVAYSLTWDRASNEARSGLPTLLANLATMTTCVYVFTLHYLGGPLRATPFSKLAVALLSTIVLLRPFYKEIAEQCWKLGPLDMLKLSQWRKAQWSALHETFKALSLEVTEDDAPDERVEREIAGNDG